MAVEVSDNGIGLTDDQVAHVFDRFWRADTARVRKSGGTGLGLTIAREDALLHGGRLQCAGELGLGATFLLAVPREVGQTWTSPLPLRVAAAEESWSDDTLWERIGDDGTTRGAEEGAPPLIPEIGRVKRELSETGSIRVVSREAQRPRPDAMSAPEAAAGETRDVMPTRGQIHISGRISHMLPVKQSRRNRRSRRREVRHNAFASYCAIDRLRACSGGLLVTATRR
ncbi:ATP-binding protein [Actinobaculum sp. 313]|uniref:ATP-binding protein n=1 Tax=Actinobaculum sp. 313 TaxID=2495645 RepID=UPI0013DE73E8|nr:ATP-binding protein [Actinobaculum sp. 313]